jgi:hypothetical protein
MAEDCADDDDDRATIAALRKAILQELSLHASVLKVPFFCPTHLLIFSFPCRTFPMESPPYCDACTHGSL